MNIAVLDLETDPFVYGKLVHPFLAGFYDGKRFIHFWGSDCIARMVTFLAEQKTRFTIYAHNGGRFDFLFFLDNLTKDLRLINRRIVQSFLGRHELRDSFAIMPFALETYKKTKIDYNHFTAENRDRHRPEIVSYLRDDCRDLFDLCTAFNQQFGKSLTIGGAALKQLKTFHSFQQGTPSYDAYFRKDFYFGGRNQVFRAGVRKAPIQIIDVNSMYPSVMRDHLHPVGIRKIHGTRISADTAFVRCIGKNDGAFPVRQKDGRLDFTVRSGAFNVSIHEFRAGEDTGSFKCERVLETIDMPERIHFDQYVDHFYNARLAAKASGDVIRTLLFKFVLNSSYGKFAQNPENFSDWCITRADELPEQWHDCRPGCLPDEDGQCPKRWTAGFINLGYIMWERPAKGRHDGYYNIATGASITGAARSVLLRGIHATPCPLYCDTDSIISDGPSGVVQNDTLLGGWKLEAEGQSIAIAGKKLYAVFDGGLTAIPDDHGKTDFVPGYGNCIKKAHKGANLSGAEVYTVAMGGEVEYCKPAPAFRFDGNHTFTRRIIRRTA